MAWYDFLSASLKTGLTRLLKPSQKQRPTLRRRQLPGGRASVDNDSQFATGSMFVLVPPADYESSWRTLNLDSKTLSRVSAAKLMEMLADLSPELSRALWDFQRFANPGWEAEALQPGTEEPSTQAQAAVDAFLAELAGEHGSVDNVIGRLFMAAFLRGAFLAELVLDEAGRMPLDIATPDPSSVRFRQYVDEVRGIRWELGQWQPQGWQPLDRETIRYIPVDPFPGSPYGRPLASPALFTCLFLIGLLHDLRRVVQQQGYPRIDISVNMERITESMPELLEDGESFQDVAQKVVDMVQEVYEQLQPDDAYIHTDVVEVNRPVGTVDSDSLGAIGGLIAALERMATRALKTMPLLLGLSESNTETQANRQYEVHAAGIKAIQHYAETLLSGLLGLALEAQGIQADVRFRFAELRGAERLRDAQAEAMEIQNAGAKYDRGWIGQEEAAEDVTGHEADVPAPRAPVGGLSFLQGDGDGMERGALVREVQASLSDVDSILARLREGEVANNGHH